jgi:hypothetical protein
MAAWSKYTSALTSRWGQVASRAKSCPKLHLTYGTTYLVADSALYRADNLQKLAYTQLK